MSLKKISISLKKCEESLGKLEKSLSLYQLEKDPVKREVYLDACIKRFEVLFEYTWKLFKLAAEYQGTEAPGPRPAIQEGLKFKWIKDPDFWTLALDARNGSVHDYLGVSTDDYLRIMDRFVRELPATFKKILELK